MIPPVNPQKPENRRCGGGWIISRVTGSEKPERPDAMRAFTSGVNQGIVGSKLVRA
jgi:hypothetical protein